MKLQILSDLHIEFAPYEIVDTDADVVILAGDIHLGDKGFKWVYDNIKGKEVIYVLGNHEFYKAATPRLIEKLRIKSKGTNIHVLENDSVSINGVRFLGCTLWTDFQLMGKMDISLALAKLHMNDYEKIRLSPLYKKIQPSFTVVWHKQSKSWLKKEIEKCEETNIVVVTHHAPSIYSIPEKDRNDPLRATYASNMDKFVSSSKVTLWIHGHIHTAFDYYIGNTRIICNPLGYPDKLKKGFNPALTVELK
jgi:Icc-related predicted phosphoesterase